jgi:hypothetical protein
MSEETKARLFRRAAPYRLVANSCVAPATVLYGLPDDEAEEWQGCDDAHDQGELFAGHGFLHALTMKLMAGSARQTPSSTRDTKKPCSTQLMLLPFRGGRC